jgi:hypothetical protein
MRNRWSFFFGKKKAKSSNPASNNAEASPSIEEPRQPAAPYNVVFIDTEFGSLAAQTVDLYTRQNAKIVEDGWLSGTVPHLDGATFWAPPKGEINYQNLKAFLSKLRDPVRLMVCAPYGERFLGENHNVMLVQLTHLFSAVGRVEIVLIGGPAWRNSKEQLLSEIYYYGGGVASSVNKILGDNSPGTTFWWGGGTRKYYDGLPEDGKKVISSEASKMLKSLREDHGVALDVTHIPEPKPVKMTYNY